MRKQDKRIFSGAFAKRGALYGPGGNGAVYVTDNGVTSLFTTVPNAGDHDHSLVSTNPILFGENQDYDFAPWVGTESLGDVDVSEDGKYLYVVNLNNKSLYVYDATLQSAEAPVKVVPIPNQCAVSSDWRPFGLGEQNGLIYVGGICSAASTVSGDAAGDASKLRSKVITFDQGSLSFTGDVVMDQPMNFQRENQVGGLNLVCASGQWRPRRDFLTQACASSGDMVLNQVTYAEPIFADIAFTASGDMLASYRDRAADQYGNGLWAPGGRSPVVVPAGDLNKACLASGLYVLDENGGCGLNNEFFKDTINVAHQESLYSGIAHSPSLPGVLTNAVDPTNVNNTMGIVSNSVQTGAIIKGLNVGPDPYGKGQGLADIEVLCDLAPIQIGNRVWNDTDRDGTQDAGETGIAGVTVNLYAADGTTLVATTVTNSNGEYYFDSRTDGIKPNTDYVIKVNKPADYAAGGPLDGRSPTVANAGANDSLDSDGAVAGGFPQSPVKTGNNGENNHTYDFGFTQPIDLSLTKVLKTTGVVHPGDTVTFELTPHNNGPADAKSGWSVTEILPAGLTLKSMSGAGYDCTTTPGTCTASSGLVANQDGAVITVTATVDAGVTGKLHNVAYVSPAAGEVVESNALVVPDTTTNTDGTNTNN